MKSHSEWQPGLGILALQRRCPGAPEPAFHAAAPASASTARPKDPQKAMRLLARQAETALFLDQSQKPLLQLANECAWKARYYETLKHCHTGCWGLGQALLQQLGLKVEMPDVRENRCHQLACDCGFWVLHHIEEESRRKRGEGRFVLRYNLDYRAQQVVNMVCKLKPGEAAAKAKAKAAAKAASKALEITGS